MICCKIENRMKSKIKKRMSLWVYSSLVHSTLSSCLFGLIISSSLLGCDVPDSKMIPSDSYVNQDLDLNPSQSIDQDVDQDIDQKLDQEVRESDQSMDQSLDQELDQTQPISADGQALYTRFCAFCHGDNGEGYVADQANALNHPDFLRTVDDLFLTQAIVHGRLGTPMSPWGIEKGGPLSAVEVDAIVRYIRQWQTEPSLDLPPLDQQGQALRGQGPYQAACASCHGDEGQGVSAISLNQPWFLATITDEALAYAIRKGRSGTAMGAYESIFNEAVIADLVAYIRSWQRPVDAEPIEPFTPQIEQAVLNPQGPLAEWTLREQRFVSAEQGYQALEQEQQFIFIDARPSADYLDEHIQGAISLPFYLINDYIEQLPSMVPIVTYCGCPHAISGQAADALLEAGFSSVAVLDEGFYVWRDEFNYPTRSGINP